MYAHEWMQGTKVDLPVGKVVCIGRNYVDHAKELGNPVPDEPVLFLKPQTALVGTSGDLVLSDRLAPIHYEAELSILIGAGLSHATEANARQAIAGIGVALDLTRRETQSALKQKGLPWELAKAFDGSCVQSPFIPFAHELKSIRYGLDVNGEARQRGDTHLMITPVVELLCHLTKYFTLLPGDIVLTGTPKGVGQLHDGDTLALTLEDETLAHFSCVSAP
ncbi:fumarylacetoacetate hydrolase family protein [Enterovibrio sp. ZSDZ35]|uniref:Fumarylacetoacetate hydrolase family protein n=1 Tax=Enterovibrio qingdaonensis TaxID=2899818 RepID=A0ABT5QJQ9_9GAMM|nr:fumarylacetoacetate hydrolase family protein [Enterovibrio sp. ZSDZ35]MDD1781225.1 fumarylacetoacetate hydrolase family protein [Enterovibrio sp. ZSDZ35]